MSKPKPFERGINAAPRRPTDFSASITLGITNAGKLGVILHDPQGALGEVAEQLQIILDAYLHQAGPPPGPSRPRRTNRAHQHAGNAEKERERTII